MADDGKHIDTGIENGSGQLGRAHKEKNASRGKARKITKEQINELAEKNKSRKREDSVRKYDERAGLFSTARIVVTGVAVIIALCAGLWALGTAGGYDRKVEAYTDKINELKSQANEAHHDSENVPTAQTLQSSMTHARERGQGLTDVQNAMINDAMGDAKDDKAMAAYARHVQDARGFIERGSLTGGDFLPHGRWFQAFEVETQKNHQKVWKAIGRDRWSWSEVKTTDINDDGTVPVIWEARFTEGDKRGELLVTVRANYEPKTDQFKSFKRIVTPMGRDFMGATTPYSVGQNQSDNANVEENESTDMSADNDGDTPQDENAPEDVPSQKDTMDDAERALEREQADKRKQEQEGK